ERRRILQLDDRDDERTRVSATVRPTEDGAPGYGRRPVPEVLANLFLGQRPGAGPLHRRSARSSMPGHRGAGDGGGDEEDGQDGGLSRIPGRRPLAPQDVEPDPAPRTRDRLADTIPTRNLSLTRSHGRPSGANRSTPGPLGCPSSRPGSSSRAADRVRPRCRCHARPSVAARDGPRRPPEEGWSRPPWWSELRMSRPAWI